MCAAALSACAAAADADSPADRHDWRLDVSLDFAAASSPLESWTRGGLGKLRHGERKDGLTANRVLADLRTRIADTWWASAALDYVEDASPGLDLTEAYLEWRPVPRSRNAHAWRFGGFYPRISLENGRAGWTSPFTISFSALNAWLGEEIRTFGAEWSMRRRLFFDHSPHELRFAAAAFYGNDPAGTLLFWRGFAPHDRQSRFDDRLPLPPRPVFGPGGVAGHAPQELTPFAETDGRPGLNALVEWRYARKALVQAAVYDNRARPDSFAGGQWGWRTRFAQLAAQVELPRGFGLVTQWLHGDTRWITATTPEGALTPASERVAEDFSAAFVMLTRRFGGRHRLSLRSENFRYDRRSEALEVDAGRAWTLAYRLDAAPRLQIAWEWLSIRSSRDLWRDFYSLPRTRREEQFRMQLELRLGPRAGR